jgi:Zn finger protein HypA/HybF involved in hydrogenase expression
VAAAKEGSQEGARQPQRLEDVTRLMMEWLQAHGLSLVGGVVVVAIFWTIIKSWAHGEKVHQASATVTAFCLHCNWEGRTARSRMQCARCGSHNLSVIVT